jgi:dihydrofolate reductase
MRKIIFSINMTIDGFADHTAGIADDELHDFFTNLLDSADTVLLGRKTYEMMASYWPFADQDPRSTKSELKFAEKYNNVFKLVFSKTIKDVKWNNTTLAKSNLIDEVLKLKNQNGKYIFAGSLSIASALAQKNLIDDYWLLIHPIVLGKGKPLFEDLKSRIDLKLVETKTFSSGVVVLHYKKT